MESGKELTSKGFYRLAGGRAKDKKDAEDMARFELRAIRDHERLKRAGVPWLPPYEVSGVIA